MEKRIYTQLNLGGNRVTNIGTPILISDAAPKSYIDTIESNLVSDVQSLTNDLADLDNRFEDLISILGPNPTLGLLALKSSIVNTDVDANAAIDWSKINKTGAVASDIGAISTIAWSTPDSIGSTTPNTGAFTQVNIWNTSITNLSTIQAYVSNSNKTHYLPDTSGTVWLHPYNNPSPYIFSHFIGSIGEFTTSVANSGSVTATTNTRTGDIRLTATSTANSRASLRSNLSTMRLGQSTGLQVDVFSCRLYISAVQASSNRAPIRWGFFNVDTLPTSNGVHFMYDANVSNNLLCITTANNVSTTIVSSIVVNAAWINTNHDYKIVITALGAQALFYYDDTLVANISTNIPTISTQEVALGASIVRVNGTSSYNLTIDHMGGGVLQNMFLL
jgi:hypothetical protein